MGSEQQKVHILAEDNRKNSSYAIGETTNPANLNFSIAQVQSVYPDRQTCDILLLSQNSFRTNIPCIIPAELLNAIGHLRVNDYVLITHKGNGMDCRIVQKLQDTNTTISNDPAFKKHSGGINFGVLAS